MTCSPESPALAAPPTAAAAADAEEEEVTTTVARHMDSIDGDDHCGRLEKGEGREGHPGVRRCV